MIEYRPFLNSDPPALIRIWQSRPDQRAMMQPMSVTLLEMFALSKPYFDRQGLIVAVDEGRPIGFAHAGFGPNRTNDALSHDIGVICMLVAERIPMRWTSSSNYCSGARATCKVAVLWNFGPEDIIRSVRSTSDSMAAAICRASSCRIRNRTNCICAGYAEVDHCVVYELDLAAFHAPVNRQQLQLKRQYQVLAQVNPESPTWWDACIFGPSDRIRFVLQEKQSGTVCGETTFWDMGPLSTRQPGNAMGLISFRVLQAQRGQGLGEFLLAESLRQLQASGISRVQAQTRRRHEAAQRVLAKVGFQPVDEGIIFGK